MGNSQLLRTIERKAYEWSVWVFGPPSKSEILYSIRRNKLILTQQLKQCGAADIRSKSFIRTKLAMYHDMERNLNESHTNQIELEIRYDFFSRLARDTDEMEYLSSHRFEQEQTMGKYHVINDDIENNQVQVYDKEEEEEKIVLALANELPDAPKTRPREPVVLYTNL
jgi:hypothetical protein